MRKGSTVPSANRYKACSAEGCDRLVGARGGRGYCQLHLKRLRNGTPFDRPKKGAIKGSPCKIPGCGKPAVIRFLCIMHRRRERAGLDMHAPARSKHGHVDKNGYILIRGTPEHRLIMEAKIGRKLYPHETVHHINGQRADNRLENLELWSSGHPYGQRVSELVKFARWVLETYGQEFL